MNYESLYRIGTSMYFAGLLIISTRVAVYGDSEFLWITHLWFAAVMGVVALSGALRGALANLRSDPGSWLIGLFLAYFFLMATLHPDTEISHSGFKNIVRNCAVPFIAGYLISKPGRSSSFGDGISLLLLGAAVFSVFLISLPHIREDIYLIHQPNGVAPQYQYFGDQLSLAAVTAILVHSRLSGPWAASHNKSWLLVPILFVFGLMAAQLVGSNNSTVLLGLLAASLGAGTVYSYVRTNRCRDLAAFLVASLAALAICAALIIALPPMRIFNFGNADARIQLPGHTSISSRIEISRNSTAQFLDSPIFGNLAADKLSGGQGEYLHSLFAVQSHLGLVGSLLLIGFLLIKLRDLYSSGPDIRKWITPPILLVSILATFFTWQVAWLLFGALLAAPRRSDLSLT